jgi:uncharacterized membrane protein YoaK (UPF0700 family)
MSAQPVGGGPRNALLVTLSFATGATDAFAFMVLGGIFTANMTGNLVLMTLTSRPHYLEALAGAAIAIAAFALTLWISFRLTRGAGDGEPASGPRVVKMIQAALALQLLTFALGFGVIHHLPGLGTFTVIAASAAAMAAQTAAAKRAGADRSITTTYLTGTITGLMQDIAENRPGERCLRLGVIAALPLGAVIAASAIQAHPMAGAAVAAAAVAVALGFARAFSRELKAPAAASKVADASSAGA